MQQQLQSTSSNYKDNIGIGIPSENQLCQLFNGMGMGMGMGMGIESEDLLCEIFLLIPPASLLRFKHVSKSWYSLISNLDFLVHHWKYWKRIDMLLLGPSCKPVVIDSALSIFRLNLFMPMSMITIKEQQHVDLLLNNTCNGLILCYSSMIDYNVSFNDNRTVFYVCNPIIKQYIKLPNIELGNAVEDAEYKTLMMNTKKACIVFDPSVSLSYKVIRCCLKQRSRCSNVLYVYSSETNSWRLLTRFRGRYDFGFRTALLNGVFYWYTDNIGDNCLSFDVQNENVWFLPLPTKPKKHRICLYFGECGGRLRLIERYHDMEPNDFLTFPCSFDIMEMEQQEEEDKKQCIWRVKYHVNIVEGFDHLIRKLERQVCIMHLYRSTTGKKKNGEEDEEDTLLMNIIGTKMVVSFNLTSNTFGDEVIEIPNIKNGSKLRHVVPYTPTLFPVHR